jgi:hypothetical protein
LETLVAKLEVFRSVVTKKIERNAIYPQFSVSSSPG